MTTFRAAAPALPLSDGPRSRAAIAVGVLGRRDLADALRAGFADFRAAPTQLAFLCALYPAIALVLARSSAGGALLPLLYPAASGFALVGPLAAVGLFEISRRRERGEAVRATDAFAVLRAPGFGAVAMLGGLLVILFVAWMGVAEAILGATTGDTAPAGMGDFAGAILDTPQGAMLVVAGNAAGLLFALVTLATATFSIPLALDRATPPLAAIAASVTVFRRNPVAMLLWGALVALILLAGSIPAFVGLSIALPVLGHATWHLYRRAIPPAS